MKEIKEQSEDFMKVHFHNKSNIPIMSGFVDEITNLMVDFYLSRPIESHSDQLIDIMNSEVSDDEIIKSTSDYCTVSHLDELVFDTDEFVKWYRTHAKEPQLTEAKVVEIAKGFAMKIFYHISNVLKKDIKLAPEFTKEQAQILTEALWLKYLKTYPEFAKQLTTPNKEE